MRALNISSENKNLLENVFIELGNLERTDAQKFQRLFSAFNSCEQCEHAQNQKGFELALMNLTNVYKQITSRRLAA